MYAAELAVVQQEIDAGLRGAVQRQWLAAADLAVVTTTGGRHRMTLNTLAGGYRVLHVQHDRDGTRFRYHDRTESWFEVVTFHAPRRRDLRPLAARLGELEPAHGGAAWCADSPMEPIPELWFGVPGKQEYGQVTRVLQPSRLAADQVTTEFAAFFAPVAGA